MDSSWDVGTDRDGGGGVKLAETQRGIDDVVVVDLVGEEGLAVGIHHEGAVGACVGEVGEVVDDVIEALGRSPRMWWTGLCSFNKLKY